MAFTTVNALLWDAQKAVEGAKAEANWAFRLDRDKKKILERVAKRLMGPLAKMLVESYARSQLAQVGDFEEKDGDAPGMLYEAVQNAEIVLTDNGLKCRFRAGLPTKVYERGGALNYGSVHGAASRRAKVKLKALNKPGKLGGGYSVRKAWHFFELDAGQIAQLRQLYEQFYQEEMNNARASA